MKIICPFDPSNSETLNHEIFPSLFLAGGISGCPDWQAELATLLNDTPLTIFNPRRPTMPQGEDAVREQIQWEFECLRKAHIISFWFPKETLCPISLYELGAWLMRRELWGHNLLNMPHHVPQILVGTHPEYARKFDIQEQLACIDKSCHEEYRIKLAYSIPELAVQIIDRMKTIQEHPGLFKYRKF